MNVVFRVDASVQIGAGHVVRCLALANALRERGAGILFLCRQHPGNLGALIAANGFQVAAMALPQQLPLAVGPDALSHHAEWLAVTWQADARESRAAIEAADTRPDWIIVDHYALDHRWERALRGVGSRIAVIDDLADREHDCELLVDQNCLPDPGSRYRGRVPADCRQLLGTGFALLRHEFLSARSTMSTRRSGHLQRILIAFGGVDVANFTCSALRVAAQLRISKLDVVVGAANPRRREIEALCGSAPDCRFHYQTSDMAGLMAQADLALVAGGFTGYEAAFMGLPALLFPQSPIQAAVAAEMAECGAAIDFGLSPELPSSALRKTLVELHEAPERMASMSDAGMKLFDGRGAERVAGALLHG